MYAIISSTPETPAKTRGNTMIHTLLVFALAIPPGLALGAYLAKKIVSL
jgi:hypothetical protein